MKKWINADIMELNINETANGVWDIGWEGPFDIVFGDKPEQKPATPSDNNTNLDS